MREGEEWARESRGDRPRPSTARTPGSEAPAHRTSCGVSGRSLRPSPGTRRKAAGLSGPWEGAELGRRLPVGSG